MGSGVSKVKELLQCFIGLVHHVSLQWLLDTDRGADYFIRWHRNREMSGSFMNNEATYHFDLLNWGIVEVPETVYGAREPTFYAISSGLYGLYGADNYATQEFSDSNPYVFLYGDKH